MRALLLPVFFYVLLNTGLCLNFKRRFGEVVPVSFIGSAMFLYMSQYLLGTYSVGLYAIFVVAIVLVFISILRRETDVSLIITPGLIAFISIILVVNVYDYHRTLTDIDEFWHWGMMIKESLRLDKFYAVEASRMIIHKDYPPFLSLIEVLWCKLAGRYSEGIATTGLHTFILSLVVCPLIEMLGSEKIVNSFRALIRAFVKSMLLIAFIVSITSAFDSTHMGNTLLADIPMAFIFAYTLFLIVFDKVYDEAFYGVCFVCSAIALVMTKQVGIALYMVGVFLYIIYGILNKKFKRINLATLASSVLFSLGFYVSWIVFVKNQNINDIRGQGGEGQFSLSKINIHEYVSAVTGKGEQIRIDTLRNLIKTVVSGNVADISFIQISFVTGLFMLILFVYILYKRNRDELSKEKAISLCVSFVIGHFGYAFMLSVLYLFCFTKDEMYELRGYIRYIDGYLLGEVLVVSIIALSIFNRNSKGDFRRLTILVMVLFVLLNGTNAQYMLPQALRDGNPYESESDYIRGKTEEDSTVKVIYDTKGRWYGEAQSYIYYWLNDRDIPWGMNYYTADFNDNSVKQSIIEEIRSKDDYIYFMDVNENLISNLGCYTADGSLEPGIYRVNTDGISIVLEHIDE